MQHKEKEKEEPKISERLRAAFEDFRQVARSGGLSQDKTLRDIARTHLALIMKIEMIGREEGVDPDFIKKEIQRIGHEETGRPN
jgi:hypothetical protein